MRMDKLTTRFQMALADAQSLALGKDHQFVEPVHVMAALLDQQDGSIRPLLGRAGVNLNALRSQLGDALDRLPIRLVLQEGVQALGIPMVHGSIAGFLGQVMTIFPDDSGLHSLYGDAGDLPEQGLEAQLGTPAATPMAVAAWEAQEVVKILTGQGESLRSRLLIVDMEAGTVDFLRLG